jgi:hypothetical protein
MRMLAATQMRTNHTSDHASRLKNDFFLATLA